MKCAPIAPMQQMGLTDISSVSARGVAFTVQFAARKIWDQFHQPDLAAHAFPPCGFTKTLLTPRHRLLTPTVRNLWLFYALKGASNVLL